MLGLLATHWGLGSDVLTDLFAPDADAGTRRALAHTSAPPPRPRPRSSCSSLAYELDVRPTLPQVQAPTLVLHRTGDRAAPLAQSRVLADAIPGAELVELEGRSHLPAIGDVEAVVDQVRRFLGLPRLRRAVPTGLTPRQPRSRPGGRRAHQPRAGRAAAHHRAVGRVAPGADPAAPGVPVAVPGRGLVRRGASRQVR